jgi:type I restriction enzyme S subunit
VKLPPYPKYKPSGVEWLGDVPEHWTQIALRRTSTRYAGGTPDRSNDSYWDEGTIPWINSGAVNQGLITEPSAFITEEAYRNSSARWVAKGALVMALAGQGKTKGMVAQIGIATTCNQSMAAICPTPPTEARYLYWLLVSQYEHIRNMAGGEARDGLNLEILGSIPCLKVLPAEQQAIAFFLDQETSRLDTLVAKKQKLIERLKEKRTALISRTVTRGLNPNAKLKPSGIAWLGDIPTNWDAKPLKFIALVKTGFAFSSDDFTDEGVPVLRIGDINRNGRIDFSDAKFLPGDFLRSNRDVIVRSGDIAMAMTGATIGKVGRYRYAKPALLNQRVCLFRPMRGAEIDFLWYLLNTDFYIEYILLTAFGGAQPNISDTQLLACSVPVPSLPEQTSIANYLNDEISKLDALVSKVETAIERLQEYRTALITAAVTGKIDARKAA